VLETLGVLELLQRAHSPSRFIGTAGSFKTFLAVANSPTPL